MGDEADWLIEQMMYGMYGEPDYWDEDGNMYRREATEVAEERLADVKKDRKVKKLNEGVIKW